MFYNFLVGSYFALQWLANLLVTAMLLGGNCVSSEMVYYVSFIAGAVVMHGLSGIGTNLLCHRYLFEKARVMISLYALLSPVPLSPLLPILTPIQHTRMFLPCCSLDGDDSSVKWLKTLEASFVWEARSLYIVAVAAPLIVIYPPAAYAVGILGTLAIVVMVRARFFVGLLFCVAISHIDYFAFFCYFRCNG
jgi:hypothetical protein